ncbi:hypothetical protein J2S43_001938 [Catenuloplanes nepalensis]|uniref:Uncharacterized protein n=1 Tax=Catenuloplanes nepalensis TaxID=587533 RepID=A0ABT9MQ51_9ACTN|nr:hypothetical protein [Catenuloplanes nepalensis]MDP9793426.1 hypothetical protein [Catenuloplanes nepalensis]
MGAFSNRLGAVLASASVFVIVLLAVPSPHGATAAGAGARVEHSVRIKNSGAYTVNACIRSKLDGPDSDARRCTGNKLVAQSETITVDDRGAGVFLDFYIQAGPSHKGYDATGRHWCTFSGTVQGAKMECESVPRPAVTQPVPTIIAFDPSSVQDDEGRRVDINLLNLLAWSVSASGVVGILIVGLNMTLQMRRGDMGFGPDQWRQLTIVGISCIIAVAVAPILTFLDIKLP